MAELQLLPAGTACLPQLADWSAQTDDADFSLSQLTQLQQRRCLYEIHNGTNSVGYLAESCVLDEAELLQLLIAPEQRRRGYAQAALHSWHRLLIQRGVVRALLEVRAGNNAAIALYLACGYERIGQRANYYTHDGLAEDAHIMHCLLSAQTN